MSKFSTKKNIEYTGTSLFLVVVAWGTLLAIDWTTGHFGETRTLPEAPEVVLKSEPKDVLYADAYVNPDGEAEVVYAYKTEPAPPSEEEEIALRTSNSQTKVLGLEQVGEKLIEKRETKFFATPKFYEDRDEWKYIEYATTTEEEFAASGAIKYVKKREFWERVLPGKTVFSAVSTFYTDYDPETTSVDGRVQVTGAVSWAAGHDATTGAGTDFVSSAHTGIQISGSGTSYSFFRSFWLFDTSSLDDNAIISAASLNLYAIQKWDEFNDIWSSITISESTPSSNTAIIGTDYDNLGIATFANIDITSITTSAYNSFTFNSFGISAISLTGVSKFGSREDHDFANTNPGSDGLSIVNFNQSLNTRTGVDPYLSVTYSIPSFSMGNWFPF